MHRIDVTEVATAVAYGDGPWLIPGTTTEYKEPEPVPGEISVARTITGVYVRYPNLDTIDPAHAWALMTEEPGQILRLRGLTGDTTWTAYIQSDNVKTGRARFAIEWAALISFHVGPVIASSAPREPISPDVAADAANALRDAEAAFTRVAALARLVVALWGDLAHAELPTDADDVVIAAHVYLAAEREGLPPRHWVQQALGGSTSRAARAIAKARAPERGLLPPVTDKRASRTRKGTR
jgi:hypothetical protein